MKCAVLVFLCCVCNCVLLAQKAGGGCKIELFMLKTHAEPQTDIDDPMGYFLPAKAELQDQPLVPDNEMLSYDINKDSTKPYYINLSKFEAKKVDSLVKKIPLHGLAFAIVVNGEPVYGGYFWSPSSSFICTWVTAYAVGDRIVIHKGYDDLGYNDPRQNAKLIDCLKLSNRLRIY